MHRAAGHLPGAPVATRALLEAGDSPQDSLVLRPIRWPEDEPFLVKVYASTRAAELAPVPWTEEQKAEFCRMQFVAQTTDYRRNYPEAMHYIIERAGVPAGRLYVDWRENAMHIIDLALLPEHRGAGTGTRVLRQLQEEAQGARKALSIHVEKLNPALRLYQRLGFELIADKGFYQLMAWPAASS